MPKSLLDILKHHLCSMQLVYYLVILPISKMGTSIRYGIATILSWVLHRVIRYRRVQVEENLALAFPGLSSDEFKALVHDVYDNLGQVIIEALRAFSMDPKDASAGIHLQQVEVLQAFFDQGRDVILTGGHYANWEAICWAGHAIPHDVYALYKPLRNAFMDKKAKASREQFGVKMISIKDYERFMAEPHDTPRMFIFAVDQRPRKSATEHIPFLGRKTAVFTGAERMAKKYNMAVVAGQLTRQTRGRYSVSFRSLISNPKKTAKGAITLAAMKDIEMLIKENPADWLWTHDRWKHTAYEAYG